MDGDATELGEFLRARREGTSPHEVGLVLDAHRRVPGLRREEVAMLAGISSDYYLRLEQGRNRNPSPSVVDTLARALRLDAAAAEHLRRLASRRPGPSRRKPRRPRVPASIEQLLTSLTIPAFVETYAFDVLAANRLAVALSPTFDVGVNRLVSLFLDPESKALFPDWNSVTADMVAAFRASGVDAGDTRIVDIVGELSLSSQRFRALWAQQEVRARVGTPPSRLDHPLLGRMTLMPRSCRSRSSPDSYSSYGTRSREASATRSSRCFP